jgi:serine protease Do
MPDSPVGMRKQSQLTPAVLCVHRARPSVVAIRHRKTRKVQGTGVVIDARGYVVTNSHVVGKQRTVAVSFLGAEDKVHAGEVAWADPSQDLAIVRISAPGRFAAIKYADLGDVQVGQTVVAIGNPLGYTGTVTVGVISALDREITMPSADVPTKVIQTDAAINPGNSGGPLLDTEGRLVGVVSAIRLGAQNIAFAIPADRVRAYVKKCLAE